MFTENIFQLFKKNKKLHLSQKQLEIEQNGQNLGITKFENTKLNFYGNALINAIYTWRSLVFVFIFNPKVKYTYTLFYRNIAREFNY